MKKTLMIFGAIFLVLVIAAVIVFAIIATKGAALDKESKAYVDEVVPIILADLNQETLFKYASPELINSASQEEFDKLFKWFKKLGEFMYYEESTGEVHMQYTPKGKTISAQYIAKVEFESGPASVAIRIIKKDGGWKIFNFRINSKVLIQ